MKKLLMVASLLLSSSSLAQQPFQTQVTLVCSSKETVFEVLTGDEFKERVVWVGRSANKKSYTALLINDDKATWTVIRFDEKNACMLDTGDESKMIVKGERIKKM